MPVYRRGVKRKGKYTYKYTGKKTNYLGNQDEEQRKLNYYLGETDSCRGDSGGPLYRFHKKKAYLVGVVARGDECAGFNQPGIYTDVFKHKTWIYKNARQGS